MSSEQMQRAALNMVGAAEQMQRAAYAYEEAIKLQERIFNEFLYSLREIMEASKPDENLKRKS